MTIQKTNNFSNPLTWVTRFIQFLTSMVVLYMIDLQEMQNGMVIGCVVGFLLAFALIFFPVDEIKQEGNKLYFLKKSILTFLNRVAVYDISRMKGIGSLSRGGAAGIHSLFIPTVSGYKVEFIFKDDSSESREVFVRKNDLKKIMISVREQIYQNNTSNSSEA
jgi:hypothetical protein